MPNIDQISFYLVIIDLLRHVDVVLGMFESHQFSAAEVQQAKDRWLAARDRAAHLASTTDLVTKTVATIVLISILVHHSPTTHHTLHTLTSHTTLTTINIITILRIHHNHSMKYSSKM